MHTPKFCARCSVDINSRLSFNAYSVIKCWLRITASSSDHSFWKCCIWFSPEKRNKINDDIHGINWEENK